MFDVGMGVALIICAVALLKYVEARAKRSGLDNGQSKQVELRLIEMESRLSDLQDIVLAMDDKLHRIEKQ